MSTNSAIVWQGPSRLADTAEIIAIVTGLNKNSANPKTGRMAQLWILHAEVNPLKAVKTGDDYAICGDCNLRGENGLGRACYIQVGQAPNNIFKTWLRGKYPGMLPYQVNTLLQERKLSLRLGAYGDPAALPTWVVAELTKGIRFTGYTHQWRTQLQYKPYCMASVDTEEEYAEAKALGWRTFRVRSEYSHLQHREITCPASDEAGHRTTCEKCLLCDGMRYNDKRADIAIIAHGIGKVQFLKMVQ